MKMRPQTTKDNMRDELRRVNKRSHGELRATRRRKKCANKKRRHRSKTTTPNKEVFHQQQQGIKDQQCGDHDPTPKIAVLTEAELERDRLKKKNEQLQEDIKLLTWRIEEQQSVHDNTYGMLLKVHQAQARHIVKLEKKLKNSCTATPKEVREIHAHGVTTAPQFEPSSNIHRWKELAGIAC